MYSLVMLAAMSAGPDLPQNSTCPVSPSKYGSSFFSKHGFYDCCAPARYGWVNCWNKGFGYIPGGGRGFTGHCWQPYGRFYSPNPCQCAPCGQGVTYGGSGLGCNTCGLGWSIGKQPAYYTSVLGCPPHMSAPPYAYYTEKNPCCKYGHFAFDTGLIGHSAGVGYAGFGGFGNFGFYGAVPMQHKPSTADLPDFPRPDYRIPSAIGNPAPMPTLPKGLAPPNPPAVDPLPKVPETPKSPIIPELRKDEPKAGTKEKLLMAEPAAATVVLSVPEGTTVTVEGTALTSTGKVRTFRTPPLGADQEFVYTVRATLLVDGREETETRQVRVIAGQTTQTSFEKLLALSDTGNPVRTAGGR